MTMCNVKSVTHSDEPTDLWSFQALILLILRPSTEQFDCTLSALVALFLAAPSRGFHLQKLTLHNSVHRQWLAVIDYCMLYYFHIVV